ncbi:RHS repeat domain-containing protein [Pseudomonas atagonensis]|uniref:RHS repeat domain-containing protein n=1 Tax=Pseudomonas atagonensis TaxID=2609964 RepID=UPI00140AD04A|nr:RHS repeat protein [Pseudomonas atagonensis]
MNAKAHWRTPTLAVVDPRSLGIRQVQYLREVANGPIQARVARQQHDVAGRPVAQFDPRLPAPNTQMVFALNGQALQTISVDSGVNVTLPGPTGESRLSWDANGNHRLMAYDNQMRPTTVTENGTPDIETFTYASHSADPDHNLRGQLIALHDPSGSVDFHSFGLMGNGLRETRTFHDRKAFVSRRTFSPLNAILETTDAGSHKQQATYDVAGQLIHTQLKVNGQLSWQTVLNDAQYNAAGQIIEQQAGNGVISQWLYRAADGRLHRHCAQKPSRETLQDFEYDYDRMGNITRILDHAYVPTFFRNQRVDGHRDFRYDSLSRLIRATGYSDAPPKDNPGRPQPTDPKDRRNYIETYEYDSGDNLVKTIHERDGACHTDEMCIDPASNRGVRWKSGTPIPDFTRLFDPAGNLLALQSGVPMSWNTRSEMENVILLDRNGSSANDAEFYRYSQSERVYKRHETHTTKVSHFHEVRYLPGLEIRTKDNGEELHVITLDVGPGGARCLHWAQDPQNIGADQLRFTLADHLGSAIKELDAQAQLISAEGYLPFGATAWMVAPPWIEVDYRFIRYSGKEMDVSGLYYYGARYYAAWLQRWISADRAGPVDGPNLYAYVSNNPLRYVDPSGGAKAESVIVLYSGFISTLEGIAEQTMGQIDNVIHQKNIKRKLAANLVSEVVGTVAGYESGNHVAKPVGNIIPDVPHFASGAIQQRLPFIDAVTAGNAGGDIAGMLTDVVTSKFTGALIPRTSTINLAAIDEAMGIPAAANGASLNWQTIKDDLIHPVLNSVLNPEFVMKRLIGAWISITGGAINMFGYAVEAEDIKNRLDPVKIGKIKTTLSDWKDATLQRAAWAESAFDALGTDTIAPTDYMPNVNYMTSPEALVPITRSGLRQTTGRTLDYIDRMEKGLAWYEAMGTTDNQHLHRQAAKEHSRLYNWWTKGG